MARALGIHHVTAIAKDPYRTLDFYTRALGLRLVKRTVNFDDPTTYHFYFGDELGRPGTILTFFPWPRGRRGQQGTGQVTIVAFSIPPSALGFWIGRLLESAISYEGPTKRAGGEQVLSFKDPDGLMLEIVADPAAKSPAGWAAAAVTAEHAIGGLHGVTLWVESGEATARVLVDTLGFRPVGEWDGTRRFAAGDGGPGTLVDIRSIGGFFAGEVGVGTVHHVAFRAADGSAQLELRTQADRSALAPTPVIDRSYFHSVYFREPGGVLFEVATDGPGFAIDEPVERLGQHLMLPSQLESHRREIEAALPPIPGEEP